MARLSLEVKSEEGDYTDSVASIEVRDEEPNLKNYWSSQQVSPRNSYQKDEIFEKQTKDSIATGYKLSLRLKQSVIDERQNSSEKSSENSSDDENDAVPVTQSEVKDYTEAEVSVEEEFDSEYTAAGQQEHAIALQQGAATRSEDNELPVLILKTDIKLENV